jgi:hypothetical protein
MDGTMTVEASRRLRRCTLLVATLLVGACAAQDITAPAREDDVSETGPQFANLNGVVLSSTTLQPVSGARVQIGELYTFTASNGSFSLVTRCDDVVTMTVTREGFQTLSQTEKFASGTNTRGIRLTPIASPNAI